METSVGELTNAKGRFQGKNVVLWYKDDSEEIAKAIGILESRGAFARNVTRNGGRPSRELVKKCIADSGEPINYLFIDEMQGVEEGEVLTMKNGTIVIVTPIGSAIELLIAS